MGAGYILVRESSILNGLNTGCKVGRSLCVVASIKLSAKADHPEGRRSCALEVGLLKLRSFISDIRTTKALWYELDTLVGVIQFPLSISFFCQNIYSKYYT